MILRRANSAQRARRSARMAAPVALVELANRQQITRHRSCGTGDRVGGALPSVTRLSAESSADPVAAETRSTHQGGRHITMSKTSTDLPYVEAELNYLGPMTERPRYYAYEAAPGEPLEHDLRSAQDAHPRSAADHVRTRRSTRQGFALVEQRTAVQDFWDDDEVRRVYYPEAERVHQTR